MNARIAAIAFCVLSTVAAAFQFALAAGAPWGEFTMGGVNRGRLPDTMRLAAAAQGGLLLAFAAVIAARGGLALPHWHRASRKLAWVVVAYCVIGTILNAITPSARERMLWLPVLVVLLGSSLLVARSK